MLLIYTNHIIVYIVILSYITLELLYYTEVHARREGYDDHHGRGEQGGLPEPRVGDVERGRLYIYIYIYMYTYSNEPFGAFGVQRGSVPSIRNICNN